MLPDVIFLASESAGAAMAESIGRIFFSAMLLAGIAILIGGAVAMRKSKVGLIILLFGAALAGFAGYSLVTL